MDITEFYQLKKKLDEEYLNCLECGDPNWPGLVLDYKNNQGERRHFRVINITSSPYNGCFEADCFSDYQFDRFEAYARHLRTPLSMLIFCWNRVCCG